MKNKSGDKPEEKKKLTVEELDLENLENVTGGTGISPGSPFTMNTGKPLPILG